jgi:hypothetical protein
VFVTRSATYLDSRIQVRTLESAGQLSPAGGVGSSFSASS